MWKSLADWMLAMVNMSRELAEHRGAIRQLEERLRNVEEAVRLLAAEQRHARELEAAEREKLLLRIEAALTKAKELPAPRGKRGEQRDGSAATTPA